MGIKYNAEKDRIEISGRIIKLVYDYITQYSGGKAKRVGNDMMYQFAIVTDAPTQELCGQIINKYYPEQDIKYIPKWLLGTADKDDQGNIIINLKSKYDIKYFDATKDEPVVYSSFEDMRAALGTPLGSDVTISARCKENAIYVSALRFDNLKAVTADAYFD